MSEFAPPESSVPSLLGKKEAMTIPDWKPSSADERVFAERFEALSKHKPFRWQWRLFERFAKAEWPHQVDLPTGLGKTSVIALWALALSRALESGRKEGSTTGLTRLLYRFRA